jgi:hypothetical protein
LIASGAKSARRSLPEPRRRGEVAALCFTFTSSFPKIYRTLLHRLFDQSRRATRRAQLRQEPVHPKVPTLAAGSNCQLPRKGSSTVLRALPERRFRSCILKGAFALKIQTSPGRPAVASKPVPEGQLMVARQFTAGPGTRCGPSGSCRMAASGSEFSRPRNGSSKEV